MSLRLYFQRIISILIGLGNTWVGFPTCLWCIYTVVNLSWNFISQNSFLVCHRVYTGHKRHFTWDLEGRSKALAIFICFKVWCRASNTVAAGMCYSWFVISPCRCEAASEPADFPPPTSFLPSAALSFGPHEYVGPSVASRLELVRNIGVLHFFPLCSTLSSFLSTKNFLVYKKTFFSSCQSGWSLETSGSMLNTEVKPCIDSSISSHNYVVSNPNNKSLF